MTRRLVSRVDTSHASDDMEQSCLLYHALELHVSVGACYSSLRYAAFEEFGWLPSVGPGSFPLLVLMAVEAFITLSIDGFR
jgi:hypothetical protein